MCSLEMIKRKSTIFLFIMCVIIALFNFDYIDTIMKRGKNLLHLDDDVIRESVYYSDSEDFVIDTDGCRIPNFMKKFKLMETKDRNMSCGQRAIFVDSISDIQVMFRIDHNIMNKYTMKKKYSCCYKFGRRSTINGKEDTLLSYTSCKPFIHGEVIVLKHEVVTVECTLIKKRLKTHLTTIYKDAYILLIKQTMKNQRIKDIKKKWNVLILGADTMSRARILSSMPKTAKYLQEHGWLDYKGYQKVGYNTFPNIMSLLTGMKVSTVYKACRPDMYTCNDLMLWSTFQKAKYITAYGEDYLRLPDTFAGGHNGFKSIPTHHYMRPFYLTGERQVGNLICTGHHSSGKHMLNYAYDFVNTYKYQRFFGMFWMNSYSHNLDNLPSLLENDLINFFHKVNRTGVMENTFIILLSDHGVRFGPMRFQMESYYEERLPMFFAWVPSQFRKQHKEYFLNLQQNQDRLVTPYDLYLTLVKVSDMSLNAADITSKACPSCKTLFEEIPTNRTCSDANVADKWCTCHDMQPTNNSEAKISLQLAVSHVQAKAEQIQTKNCSKCDRLQFGTTLRTHRYMKGSKTFYIIAFLMKPGNVGYEATVLKDNNMYTIVNEVDTITGYNARGHCVKRPNDRMYCVCKKVKC